jgi:hypothetical protein
MTIMSKATQKNCHPVFPKNTYSKQPQSKLLPRMILIAIATITMKVNPDKFIYPILTVREYIKSEANTISAKITETANIGTILIGIIWYLMIACIKVSISSIFVTAEKKKIPEIMILKIRRAKFINFLSIVLLHFYLCILLAWIRPLNTTPACNTRQSEIQLTPYRFVQINRSAVL